MIETMRGAQRSLNFLTYLYWSGEIAGEIASTLCERAKAGVEVNVLLDAVGTQPRRSTCSAGTGARASTRSPRG
jgi:cardiolipin synthase